MAGTLGAPGRPPRIPAGGRPRISSETPSARCPSDIPIRGRLDSGEALALSRSTPQAGEQAAHGRAGGGSQVADFGSANRVRGSTRPRAASPGEAAILGPRAGRARRACPGGTGQSTLDDLCGRFVWLQPPRLRRSTIGPRRVRSQRRPSPAGSRRTTGDFSMSCRSSATGRTRILGDFLVDPRIPARVLRWRSLDVPVRQRLFGGRTDHGHEVEETDAVEASLSERLGGVFAIAAVVDQFGDAVVRTRSSASNQRIRPARMAHPQSRSAAGPEVHAYPVVLQRG